VSILALFLGGIALLVAAAVLTVVFASRLARSTRPPDTQRRRHLLIAAAVLAAMCVICTAAFWIELGITENWHGDKLVHNAVFFATAIGALVCLVVGLRTPRTPTGATHVAGAH
jgi:Na+/H+ antiporter NhaD/arsenite permease-like protein